MPLYESVFIARQDISSQQVESLTENLTKIITENGGEIAKSEYWGLRNLAYRIKKNRKGHYVLFNIDAPAGAIQEYERNMRISEDVLRYLTIRIDELEEGPSIQMQSRRAREERQRARREERAPSERGGARGSSEERATSERGGARGASKEPAKPEGDKGGDQ